jgi:hypothetical protein
MPKMLNMDNRLLLWVPDGGIADISHPTLAELAAAGVVDISCLVTLANYSLGATGDEAINDPALCAPGDSPAPGATSYEAIMEFFRWTTPEEDIAWDTFTGKGISGFFVERKEHPHTTALAANQEVKVVGVITGTPRDLSPSTRGFEKFHLESMVQSELVDERALIAA